MVLPVRDFFVKLLLEVTLMVFSCCRKADMAGLHHRGCDWWPGLFCQHWWAGCYGWWACLSVSAPTGLPVSLLRPTLTHNPFGFWSHRNMLLSMLFSLLMEYNLMRTKDCYRSSFKPFIHTARTLTTNLTLFFLFFFSNLTLIRQGIGGYRIRKIGLRSCF